MSGIENLMSKEFKVLLLLYDTRRMGNMVNYRQIDVAKDLDLARNTIGTVYKNLTDMGYLDSASDKYYITQKGIKLCEEFNKINETTKVLMYCTKCGKPITDDWDYCRNCGHSLKNDKIEIEQENKIELENKKELNVIPDSQKFGENENKKDKEDGYSKKQEENNVFDKSQISEENFLNRKDKDEFGKVIETQNNILQYCEETEQVMNKKDCKVSKDILNRYLERNKDNGVSSGIMNIYNRKGIIINVPSGCNYLVSFLLAYQVYLKSAKSLKCKLLFLNSKSKYMTDKFSTALWFREFKVDSSMSVEDVVAEYSDKDVLYNGEESASMLSIFMLLNIPADVYIIVDYNMDNYLDKKVTGEYLTHLWAVNAISDIDLLGLAPERTIISVRGFSSNIIIPYMKDYGYDKLKRVGPVGRCEKYYEACSKTAYKKLDKILDILDK